MPISGRLSKAARTKHQHDGQNTCGLPETCQSLRAKINLFAKTRNTPISLPSRACYGGRFANAMRRGAGSDGRKGYAGDAYPARTVKPRGPVPPTLGISE